ncbi:glucarate dehydratase [Allocatelliglobosispora scoriae]|uniref:glucarate dehydratase n=1 Tax=Allocatelliglobosispora scoriae TaxID=643052 RepID=A0A841BTF1_9ACTN|nr:glucarate dehydratase family protein [Allocatelliglobosispora scoriae]MBB5870708.1 glucarate dehydratase [Allocatelliglobosispora scoriae]
MTRIREVRITPIAFPDPPLLNAVGCHEPWALRTIVELETDDGLIGLGETYGDAPHVALLRRVAPELIGVDPFQTGQLRSIVDAMLGVTDAPDLHGLTGGSSPIKTALRVFATFEVACLDLQGQAIGRPVHDLLGGKVRDAVPFSAYLFYKWAGHPDAEPDAFGAALDPAGIVAQARTLIEAHGFQSIKLKGGVFPPDEELDAVRGLRAAFPAMPLRIDPNAAWSVETSRRVAAETQGLLEYLEDPTEGLAGMAAVAQTATMPLATNMCVVAFDHLPEAVERGSVQVILSDHHYWGGLRQSVRLAGICETWGLGVSMHSNSHLGISLAAMTHLGAALPQLSYAADTHTPWQLGLDVVERPLRFVDGAVPVPTGPGLGVTLDRDMLARLHENYVRVGITARDDTGYMRRLQPGFDPARPRW